MVMEEEGFCAEDCRKVLMKERSCISIVVIR